MLVHRLRLVNFRQHEDTDLRFDLGLTGVIGPNGAGKTTLLEALAWALYGSKAARGTADSIRRRNAPPRARVEVTLEFTLGPHRYRVARTLHGAELLQDGDPNPIANSTAAVTDRVTRLLGMTREEFFNTYFTGQKDLAVMQATAPAERERFLSRVLGYERLATAQKRLSTDRTTLRAQVQAREALLISPAQLAGEEAAAAAAAATAESAAAAARVSHAEARTAVDALEPGWQAMAALQERMRQLEADRRLVAQQVTSAQDALVRLERDLEEATAAVSRTQELAPRLEPLPRLRDELVALEALAARLARQREALGRAKLLRQRLAELDRLVADAPSPQALEAAREALQVARAAQAAAEAAAEQARTDWVRDRQEVETELKQLREQYQDTKAQHDRVQESGAAGACPTCGRPLGDDATTVLADLARQLEQLTFNGNYFRQRLEQLKAEPAVVTEARTSSEARRLEATQRAEAVARLETGVQGRERLLKEAGEARQGLAAAEATVGEVAEGYDEARHGEVRAAIEALAPARLEVDQLKLLVERAPALAAQADNLRTALAAHQARLDTLEAEERASGWSVETFQRLRDQVAVARQSLHAAELRLATTDAEVRAAAGMVAAAARRREERRGQEAELRQVQGALQLNQELDRAFSDLRGELNETLRPDLSDLGSRFLQALSAGRYTEFELDQDYLPGIVDDGEPLRVLSGGEEDIVNLALRLAISQMIAERAGQPLSLLVLDEIFGSLDEDRRTAVVDLLRQLAGQFPQVILITHIESVRDGFDRVLRLRYDVERGVAGMVEEPRRGHDAAA